MIRRLPRSETWSNLEPIAEGDTLHDEHFVVYTAQRNVGQRAPLWVHGILVMYEGDIDQRYEVGVVDIVRLTIQHRRTPRPEILYCTVCGLRHVDRGEWATRPHRTHLCEHCGNQWRPSPECTVGVEVV